MSKITIRENNVLAVETRSGLYVIAQALQHKTIVFYNLFTREPLSICDDLDNAEFLCCVTPTKDFFNKSNIIKLKIKPAANIAHYRTQARLAFTLGSHWESVIIYKGTKDELEIPLVLTGELQLVDQKRQIIKHLDKQRDQATIDLHPLETMGIYGELNERLYLCYRFGKYVEPIKDLLMNRELPMAYKTYFQIRASEISEEDWLRLPVENIL